MKLSLNLASPQNLRERHGLAISVLALALALTALALLAASGISNFRKYRSVERSLTALRARHEDASAKEGSLRKELNTPEMLRLADETNYVNGLIAEKDFSVTELTSKVSRLLPPDVRLDGMGFSVAASPQLINLEVEAKSEKALEAFLNNLEGSPDFSDVVVGSQGFAAGGKDSGTMLATCTARYLGTGPVSQSQSVSDAETASQDNSTSR